MRKKTINRIYDYIFYGIIYLIPVILIWISLGKYGNMTIYETFVNNSGITSNVFTNAFNEMFITYLGFFENANNVLLQIFDYMLYVTMLHLVFDIFNCVPKLIMKILNKWGIENE